MQKKRFNTIDGDTLMSMPLQPINLIIDTLISQGLSILAGASKTGKSWLALWLSVMVAKGKDVWGRKVKQGTTLYLCLEDNTVRIQNLLFEITEDAPPSVHFTTEALTIGQGIEEQIDTFINEHPDTVLVIIDTMQMIRNSGCDTSYANDYRELSVIKKLADKHSIAILLIHHLNKDEDAETFNRISGTTAVQGAPDTSFTLVEDKRGSGKALLSGIGRDIGYREIELKRNDENVWEVVSDSYNQPEMLMDNVIILLSEFMKERSEYTGTPTDVAERLSALSDEKVSSKILSKRLIQNRDELADLGISFDNRRSNGKRLITLRRASDDSDVETGRGPSHAFTVPVDPDVSECEKNRDSGPAA